MLLRIAFSCDQNYVHFLATTIASILKNADINDNFEFYVIEDSIKDEDKLKIEALSTLKEFSITYISAAKLIEDFTFVIPPHFHFSKAAYFRLFLADILPDINKIIYLDIDIIVLSSLASLYNINIENEYFAACPQFHTVEGEINNILRLSLFEKKYFNSGVLLLNLEKWRKDNISQKLISTMHTIKDKIFWVDQDVMNYYFKNFHELDKKWNCEAEFYETRSDISIVHFQGGDKFSFSCSSLLHDYISLTPYKKFSLTKQNIESHFSLKSFLKKEGKYIFSMLIKNKKFASIFKKLGDIASSSLPKDSSFQEDIRQKFIIQAASAHFPDKSVKHGPFKNMKYPSYQSVCSTLFPKLLGSYENEIQQYIQELIDLSPEQIIDIGCAEGYYTVGLALRCPHALVYAFDENQTARRLCSDMAKLNSVDKKIKIFGCCRDQNDLLNIQNRLKTVVVCDIEGFEKKILSSRVFEHFSQASFLIEVHDCFDMETSSTLKSSFKKTHNYKEVFAIDDVNKAYIYDYNEIANYHFELKKLLLAENRPAGMKWFFLTPKC